MNDDLKLWVFVVLPLASLLAYVWIFHSPNDNYSDSEWCHDNGGRWISSYYNEHCQWVPVENLER